MNTLITCNPRIAAIQSNFDLEKIFALVSKSDASLFVVSKSMIARQYQKIKDHLPMVKPHYAIKSLPLEAVIETLRDQDGYFDVASNGEIELLKKVGVNPRRCIHSHPIKQKNDIEHALDFGITTFVIDNECELKKLLPYKEKIKVLVRLAFPNKGAKCDLSAKFGVHIEDALSLVLRADDFGLNVIGLSFHVGSQCQSNAKVLEALAFCKAFYQEVQEYGLQFSLLDMGGGFPANYDDMPWDEDVFFAPIADYLTNHFCAYEIISEPGRYISAPCALLFCKVIGQAKRAGNICYYLNDGVYNNFSGMLFEHTHYPLFTQAQLQDKNDLDLPMYPSTLFGPTCDNVDVIATNILLPQLATDDILVASEIGAYSLASATDFNFLGHSVLLIED